jgi:1-deoxy-D-xylulose-5-phosphate reductoisomerase
MAASRRLSVLGSTGSIGTSTLDIVRKNPARFTVDALASRGDWQGIVEQAREVKPSLVALFNQEAADRARDELAGSGISVVEGMEGILEAATMEKADIVVSSIVGAAGIMPTFAAVEAGKKVALANKEALVAAGSLITEEAKSRGAELIPVDSEHSAVFQVLQGQDMSALKKLVLTASGGPFFGKERAVLDAVTPEMALDHPNWSMGPKVTVDSATMMNKGLEVIEARWLFGLPAERIEVMVHPQSIVHSMVEFADGSNLAQLGIADMRIPISYALAYPERVELDLPDLNLTSIGKLEFYDPDMELFPCLKLAYDALAQGGGTPAVMNAANEVAVEAFLEGDLAFHAIPDVVGRTMGSHPEIDDTNLSGILRGDRAARERAREIIQGENRNNGD